MISLNDKKIKQNLTINIPNIEKIVKNIENNIDLIKNFSAMLSIESTVETTQSIANNDRNVLYVLKAYEALLYSNDYSSFKCPLCKNNNLHYHKTYTRNITLVISNHIIDAKIELIVVECLDCKKENKQHYHVILPDNVLPYHLFSSSIVLNSIKAKIKKIKNEIILERYRISRQLLNQWLKLFDRYLISSSTITKTIIDRSKIIKGILDNREEFQYQFYEHFFHPYFLNKLTCVKLAITP